MPVAVDLSLNAREPKLISRAAHSSAAAAAAPPPADRERVGAAHEAAARLTEAIGAVLHPPPFSALSTCKCSPLRFSCQAHLGSATIDLRGARLGGARLRRLCDVMVSATLLQRLDLSGNELLCADAVHLAEVRDP
jgi:hypothetical protein